jgi:hypothetical protein
MLEPGDGEIEKEAFNMTPRVSSYLETKKVLTFRYPYNDRLSFGNLRMRNIPHPITPIFSNIVAHTCFLIQGYTSASAQHSIIS